MSYNQYEPELLDMGSLEGEGVLLIMGLHYTRLQEGLLCPVLRAP